MKGKYQNHELKSITKWVEKIFRRSWLTYKIEDIITDFSRGLIAIHLVRALAQQKLPVLYPEPTTLEQKIGNIELALQAFKEDGVECPGIFANDIANKDHEIIIAFCFMLKHHYSRDEKAPVFHTLNYHRSVSKDLDGTDCYRIAEYNGSPPGMHGHSEAPLKNVKFLPYEKEDIAVFEWVGNQIGVQIHDYDVFKDGVLLCKLVNKVSVRKIPEKVIANSSKSERVKLSLRFAAHELGIAIRLDPNDVIRGKERILLREYICLLKTLKSKQDQLMMSQLESLEGYSDLVHSFNFSNKVSQQPSPNGLRNPLHDDLCRNISKGTLCERLALDCSMRSCDT